LTLSGGIAKSPFARTIVLGANDDFGFACTILADFAIWAVRLQMASIINGGFAAGQSRFVTNEAACTTGIAAGLSAGAGVILADTADANLTIKASARTPPRTCCAGGIITAAIQARGTKKHRTKPYYGRKTILHFILPSKKRVNMKTVGNSFLNDTKFASIIAEFFCFFR